MHRDITSRSLSTSLFSCEHQQTSIIKTAIQLFLLVDYRLQLQVPSLLVLFLFFFVYSFLGGGKSFSLQKACILFTCFWQYKQAINDTAGLQSIHLSDRLGRHWAVRRVVCALLCRWSCSGGGVGKELQQQCRSGTLAPTAAPSFAVGGRCTSPAALPPCPPGVNSSPSYCKLQLPQPLPPKLFYDAWFLTATASHGGNHCFPYFVPSPAFFFGSLDSTLPAFGRGCSQLVTQKENSLGRDPELTSVWIFTNRS